MIDWHLTANLLRTHYKPLERVAAELGINRQHINRLARGDVEQPRFNTGMKLLDLAYDVLPPEQFARIKQQ